MTWNATLQRWEFEFTVPAAATQRVAFVFHDGAGTWHNNYDLNWQALLARASVAPDPAGGGLDAAIRYEADMGPLAGAARVDGVGGVRRGEDPGDRTRWRWRTCTGARWECTVPVPAHAENLSWHSPRTTTGGTTIGGGSGRFRWRGRRAALAAGGGGGAGSPAIADNPEGELPDNAATISIWRWRARR
jgi:hypothetical protein